MPEAQPAIGVALIAGADPGSAGLAELTVPPAEVVVGEPLPDREAAVDFWVLVGAGCRLRADFVDRVATVLADAPTDTCLYTDFLLGHGRERVRVGEWSVERSRWQDATGPVIVVGSAAVARSPRGIPVRVAAPRLASEVRYLAEPLYSAAEDRVASIDPRWRGLLFPGLPYTVTGAWPRATRHLHRQATVSVLIPTRGSWGAIGGHPKRLVDNCLTALRPVLERPGNQLVLSLDADGDREFVEPWRRLLGDRLAVVTAEGPFNFSRKINMAAAVATGEFLVLLNDDVQPITADWLEQMVALAAEPDVGAVGALLVYEDGRIQHAGHAFTEHGVHLIDKGLPLGPGPRSRNACDRDVSGVTAACLVQRRSVWEELGGLDPSFPVAFNDVDYCERIRAAGLRVVQCNLARLYHFESRTRTGTAEPQEVARIMSRLRHSPTVQPDPFTPDLTVTFPAGLRHRLDRARETLATEGVPGLWRRARKVRWAGGAVDSARVR